MITKEGSTKIVNFMIYGAGVLMLGRNPISHIMKMHYSFTDMSTFREDNCNCKNLLLYSQAEIRQTKYIVMMTKEGSTKIVNFIHLHKTPGPGVMKFTILVDSSLVISTIYLVCLIDAWK